MRNLHFLSMAVILSLFVGTGTAFAANPVRIQNSANDLVGEVKDTLDAGFLTSEYPQYIPGYGFHLFVDKSRSLPKLDEAIEDISSTLLKYNETVIGLPGSEWISVFLRARGEYDLLIRMNQGQSSSLEVWVDGTLERQ